MTGTTGLVSLRVSIDRPGAPRLHDGLAVGLGVTTANEHLI
jgi:hypothetical protein